MVDITGVDRNLKCDMKASLIHIQNAYNNIHRYGPNSLFFTCRLLAEFPLSVAIETSLAAAIVKAAVVNRATQRERNCTAWRRDGCRHNWSCIT